MLNFYTDSALNNQITSAYTERICMPSAGGSKIVSVYLGDPYSTFLATATSAGATTVFLQDTSEFLTSGTATINGVDFTYTGTTNDSLTGCSGVPAATIGTTIRPHTIYVASGNVTVYPTGIGFTPEFSIQLSSNYPTVGFGFAQNPVIYSSTYIDIQTPLRVYIQANVLAGAIADFTNWGLSTSGFAIRDISDNTPATTTEGLVQPYMYGEIYRADQSPTFNQRIFQLSRQITNLNPGFVVGEYRWRDKQTINGYGFIPPNWNLDPVAIGTQKFQSGIGYGSDLEVIDLVAVGTSIYPVLNGGQYFYEPFRNYLPVDPVVEILNGTVLNHTLTQTPVPQTPIEVGLWLLNTNGAYLPGTVYSYTGVLNNPDGTARTDLPEYYFSINRTTNVVTLNTVMPTQTMYMGQIQGTTTVFNLPAYPITSAISIYAYYGGAKPNAYASYTAFNDTNRQVTVTIPGTNPGDGVYIEFSPTLMCLYDVGIGSRTETSVDINPANAGIASGYYYLEHRSRTISSITLVSDKPEIDIPATFTSVINVIAYGPVYSQGDYSILTGAATTASGEVVPGATLNVIVGVGFTGLINYVDPVTEPVTVVTGGDGEVNFIYTPFGQPGYYIPPVAATGSLAGLKTTTIVNDTLVLPVPISISQIWNASEGWLVYTYNVLNNQPFYGQIGANTSLGQIPYVTTGTEGGSNWQSNGEIIVLSNGSNYVYPINALDSNGNSYTSDEFSGNVTQLVYASSMLTTTDIGAYFVSYLQRVTIQLFDPNTGIYSNTVILQMQYPSVIQDNEWLYLNNATSGLLNSFRLGWVNPGGN